MGLFGSNHTTIALIDVNSSSVGGGYASMGKDGIPRLHYATRIPIELHDRELGVPDMLRALHALGKKLLTEGTPVLRKAVGTGRVDRVVASVGSPWQETKIRTEVIEKEKPFTFTKALLAEAVSRNGKLTEGHVASEEQVVAALLNGYETRNPFGKKATRAELVILSSSLEYAVSEAIKEVLTHLYHTRDIRLSAFAPTAYTVFRDLYPHEKDFLVIHVSGEATDMALVKRGLLVDVSTVTCGLNGLVRAARKGVPLSVADDANSAACKEWLESIAGALRTFSENRALPRTVFLLADEDSRAYLSRMLDDQALHSLWLSDDALTIIPSVPQHLFEYMTCDEVCEKDLYLSLLALSVGRRAGLER